MDISHQRWCTVKYRNSVDIVHEIMSNAIMTSQVITQNTSFEGFLDKSNAYFSIPTPKDFITK